MNEQNRNKLTEIENKLIVPQTGGASGELVWEDKEIMKCKLPVEKQSLRYKVHCRKDSHNYAWCQISTRLIR